MQSSFLRKTAIAAILLAVPLVLLCFAFLLPPQYDGTYLAGLQDKTELLKNTEGRKIVLIGGSGAAFDIRSDLLEEQLPRYSVVNYGLYAGLGTTVMLDLSKPYIREGDLVIFLPEQNEQTLSTFFDAESLWQASDGAFPPLPRLGSGENGRMLGAFGRFAAAKARLFFSGDKPSGDGVYSRASFNRYGDIACPGRGQNRMADGYDPATPVSFSPSLPTEEFVSRVNAFDRSCRKKGASLFFAFCPMNSAAVSEKELAQADDYVSRLTKRLTCPILGAPEDAVMDAGWFFDTNFHLNEAGQIAYTARLARLLKDVLHDGSPVTIRVPDMPAFGQNEIWDGDNSDEACFLYAPFGDGCRITALSGSGRDRAVLTVPALHDGLPVRGFDASVFAGNGTLRSVTVGRNVTSLTDGSFSGCSSLETIVLVNPSPETCSLGRGLLDGTPAMIAVPPSAYSAYATGYFWAPYASRLVKQDAKNP